MRRTTAICLLFALTVALARPAGAEDPKAAIIFFDHEGSSYDLFWQTPRAIAEAAYYESKGYVVGFRPGTAETLFAAIMSPHVDAVSFFSHGLGADDEGVTSTVFQTNATEWRNAIAQKMLRFYRNKGYSQPEAVALVKKDSKNFGFSIVRNHACGSLYDTDIADLFTKPGGFYYGVKDLYVPCPAWEALLADTSFFLDEYQVPEETGVFATDFGDITFPAFEGSITATFPDGEISGHFSGNKLYGIWTQSKARFKCPAQHEGTWYWGNYGFTFNDDYTSFTGYWTYCDQSLAQPWNGKRKP